jgi:hypothetical protein
VKDHGKKKMNLKKLMNPLTNENISFHLDLNVYRRKIHFFYLFREKEVI